ncbi:hypothetical protein M8J77_021345 [Diaphorina citri]|nr:hypothetical protein M8J77_021345 [Diaphorina citri]
MASGSKDTESAILQRLEEMQMSQKKEAKYIKTYLSKLNNTNKAIEKKVDEIKESNAEMREKVQSLEKRIDPIERERRQKNILIYGLKEEQNETWQALENMVLNTFQNQMKINIQLHEIDRIKRVGRKVSSEGRLVIVTLTTIRRKIDIIRNRRELRGTTVRIQEDFTKEVVEARKRLYPQLKMMREKGRKAVMRYDKLYIDGVVWNGGNNEEKEEVRQKRKPSESPEVRTENGGKQVKRKPNAQHYEMNSDEEEDMEFYTDSEEFNHEDTTQETLLQIEKQLMNTSPQGLVYFNPSYNPHTWFEVFEETLDKVESAHTGCNFILCGDFNSRIGDLQDEEDTIFEDTILEARRNSLDKTVNTRGRLLLDLFEKHALYCLNGRSPGDIPGNFTFIGGQGKSVIDYFVTNMTNLPNIQEMNVLEIATAADHLPLELCLNTNLRDQETEDRGNNLEVRYKPRKWKWKEELGKEYGKNMTRSVTSEEIKKIATSSTRESYLILRQLITNAAEKMKVKTNKNFKKTKNLWFNTKCRVKKRELLRTLRKCRDENFEKSKVQEYLTKRKEYRVALNEAKQEKNDEIKTKLSQTKNGAEFWKTIKIFRPKKEYTDPVDKSIWTEFLHSIYPEKQNIYLDMYDVRDPYLDRTITMWELNQVLKLAKKNKAPGSDEIPNEFYKNLPESSRHFLLDLFNKVFETREIPGEWSDAVLQMIHKKGDPKNPSNYRGIALVNTISKLFINIIQERIYTWAEKLKILDEGQAGFRKGRGCVDNLFTFYSVLCINLNRNKKVFCCYVDFRRAFDLVPHELLWKHLFKLGLSTHLINVVKSLYDKARVKIRTDNGYGFTDEVDMSIGLMQGLGISPLLYILFISDLVEYLKQNGVNGVTVDSTFRMIALMYADDLVLLAESDEEMQNMLNVFHRYCQEKQLVVNVDKTKIMIFRRKGRVSKKYKFTMGRDTLEIVSQYIYLGVLFTAQACFRENAKRVVNKTSSATSVVNSIWAKSRTHCWEAKQTVYKAMVKSVLMYAAEVWGARYVEQLEMAQVRYFKYMFLWPRNTPNYMVRQECGVSATSVELFRKMLGWWIKMLEMPEDRYPKICYNVLKEMEERSPLDTTHNWAAQLRERLLGLEYEQLYQEGTSRDIKNELENIIQKFEKKSKEEDMTRIQQSSYSTVYRELTEEGGGGTYLSYGMHMGKIRLASQLRIAADKCLRINVNGNYYKIDMDVVCSVCNMGKNEDLIHLLFQCPMYRETRGRIRKYINQQNLKQSLSSLLKFENEEKITDVYSYVVIMLRIRSFIIGE